MNIHASDLNPLRAPYPELGGRDAMEAIAYPAVMGAAAGLMPFTGAGGVLEGKTAAQARGLLGVGPALLGNATIYVSTTGSDTTGDGSAAKPFASIQHAVDAIPAWMAEYDATIQIAPGSYAENVLIKGKVGGTVTLRSTAPTSEVTIGGLWFNGTRVTLYAITLNVIYNSTLSYANFGGGAIGLFNLNMEAMLYQDNSTIVIDGAGAAYTGLSASNCSNLGVAASMYKITIKNLRTVDGIAVLAHSGSSIVLGEATIQQYKTGLFATYLGRISYVSLAATSSYAGSTKITTSIGGRVLLGGNADTTNYQY